MIPEEIQNYKDKIIPNIKKELKDKTKSKEELLELYNLYDEILCIIAPYDFSSFNDYLEFEEDKSLDNRGFHHHRKKAMNDVINSLNDMEINNKYDILLISLPPRTGKTTYGIRFLAWICGKYPGYTQLATSYSDNITSSFYNGVMEVIQNPRFIKCFPESTLVNQNAKREEIWLKTVRRYPSIAFVPVGGSVTGRVEANNYLYADDLVSGIEEAMSITRLEKLWQIFSVNFYQRRKEGCKLIMVATKWSVHDPISIVERENEDNPRCKVIKIPCFDEDGESNFKFKGGFSKEYYLDLKNTMEEISFNSLYMCDPIEREGILYNKDDLAYYFELPEERPDTIVAVCDSKNMGKDFVCSPIGYVYGETVYVDAVVFNNGLPDVTRPLVANAWVDNNVVRADVEMNNGGNYYAEDLDSMVKSKGGKTSIRTFFTGNNKNVKIITYSDYVKKHFVFRHPSTYAPKSEYGQFMGALLKWTQTGNNKHDDAPDAIAMLAQLVQELSGCYIKIINRRELGL